MAILRYVEACDEVVLEILPQSARELLVIHCHAREESVRTALQWTPIGLQVIYRLVEVMRSWPQSIPTELHCLSMVERNRNGEFLERLIHDVEVATDQYRATAIEECTSADLQLPGRLVHALILMNATAGVEQSECFICGHSIDKDRRSGLLPTDLELRSSTSRCGYWCLASISLSPGFMDGVHKLCADHEGALNKVFRGLMVRNIYYANPRMGV